jgi:hypothetical protein
MSSDSPHPFWEKGRDVAGDGCASIRRRASGSGGSPARPGANLKTGLTPLLRLAPGKRSLESWE